MKIENLLKFVDIWYFLLLIIFNFK